MLREDCKEHPGTSGVQGQRAGQKLLRELAVGRLPLGENNSRLQRVQEVRQRLPATRQQEAPDGREKRRQHGRTS